MSWPDPPVAPSTFAPFDPKAATDESLDAIDPPGSRVRLLQPGDRVDRYIVESWLGDGGVASVYRVRHRTLQTVHALKVLRFLRPDLLERLLAEGRLQARLSHPNIIRVQDVLEVQDAPALLMDYAEGRSLAQRLAQGPLELDQVEDIFRAMVSAVGYAHEQGVVHRDLKPGNVLLVSGGGRLRPRVTDFGIARHLWMEEQPEWTRTGALLGTPDYMAPEQLRDTRQVNARADVFSLGVILYELCCNRRPFVGPDLLSRLNALARAEYVPPRDLRPELPAPLVAVIEACLVADPGARAADCATLLGLLEGQEGALRPERPLPAPSLERSIEPGVTLPAEAGAQSGGAQSAGVQSAGAQSAGVQSAGAPFTGVQNAADATTARANRVRHVRSRALTATMTLGLLGIIGLMAWRMQMQRQTADRQLEVLKLRARAWERADEQPAEALALLLGAAAVAGKAGETLTDPVASVEEVYRLAARGGASRVIPTGQQVLALDLSPDGANIAGGLEGGALAVWDRRTGRERFRTRAGVGPLMSAVQFTADGRQLVVVPEWGAESPTEPTPVRSFDPLTGQARYTFAHGAYTTRFIFSPDGTRAVTASRDSMVRIWTLNTGSPDVTLALPEKTFDPCLAVSPDNRLLAVGQTPRVVWLYDLTSQRLVRTLTTPFDLNGCHMQFSPDGRGLNIGGLHGTATLQIDGKILAANTQSSQWIFEMGPDGSLLLEGDRQPTVSIRRLPGLELISSLSANSSGIIAARFSPSGRQVTTASNDGRVVTWDALSGRPDRSHLGHRSRVTAIEQGGPSDDLLITGSRDATVRLWSRGEPDDGLGALRPLNNTRSSSFTASEDFTLLAYLGEDRVVHVRDLETQRDFPLPVRFDTPPMAMEFSADRRMLVVQTPDELAAFKLEPAPVLLFRSLTPYGNRWLELSHDGRWILGYSDDPGMYLFDVQAGGSLRRLSLPSLPFRVAFTPDSRQLVVGTRAGQLMWMKLEGPGQAADRAPFQSAQIFERGVAGLRLLPDSHEVLLSGWAGQILRWSLETGTQTGALIGHKDAVLRLELSPDKATAASVSWDRTVRLWDPRSGRARGILDNGSSDPTLLAFSADGLRLAVGSRDGNIRLWDVPHGQLMAMRSLNSSVAALGFARKGLELRVLDLDGQAFAWDLAGLPAAPDPIGLAGRLTNLRLCPGTLQVVPVVPFPSPETLVAPGQACAPAAGNGAGQAQ